MKAYESYKDTGVQWLGQIPSHWNFSSLIYALKGKIIDGPHETPDVRDSGIPFVSVDSINESENVDFSVVKKFISNEDFERFKKKTNLEINDVIFTKAATIGKTAIVKSNDYMVWSPLAILKPSKETYFKYLYYVVSSKGYRENVFLSATFNTQWNIGMRDLEKTSIPRPPYDEQKAIADFLDAKTTELDAEKENLNKQIEVLKELKRSIITQAITRGVRNNVSLKTTHKNFLSLIPETWQLKKVKYICDIFGRIGYRGYTNNDIVAEGEGAITLSPSNMTAGKMTFDKLTYLSWQKYFESPEIQIFEGDVLMVKTGSSYGKCSYVENLPMESTINPQIIVFKNFRENAKFLTYCFQTYIGRYHVETTVVGGTIPTISQEKISNYFFPVPPKEEQSEIVEYLDKKTTEIDEQIKLQEQQIQLIDELKQSIISQAVTCKIKVI
jgi:type I restriction enzyme S subunit